MAFTTWNPSDKTANCTLSGGNLIATATNAATNSVRAVDKQSTGKHYWEVTINATGSALTGVGIHTPTAAMPASYSGGTGPAAGTCGIIQSGGNIYADGAYSGMTLVALAAGNTICVAVDPVARLIWFRLGAAGNWNGNANANPATGALGVAFTTLGGGEAIMPSVVMGATNDQLTANFGATGFIGAVPAGFTSGFVAGVATPNNAIATQTGVEQFVTQAGVVWGQVTQVGLEHWASASAAVPEQMIVTQVGLEQWIAITPPPFYEARTMIMA